MNIQQQDTPTNVPECSFVIVLTPGNIGWGILLLISMSPDVSCVFMTPEVQSKGGGVDRWGVLARSPNTISLLS